MLRKLLSGAAVAGLVLISVGLGVAAPAEALQVAPTGPPKLTLPGSELTGAAGGSGTAAAEMAGSAAASSGARAAFAATALTKTVGVAGQVVSSFNLGTFIGAGIDSQLGIDLNGNVCGNTADDLGGNILRSLSGADCNAWQMAKDYVPNTDAPTTTTGSTLSFTSTDGKIYTFVITGMTTAPNTFSSTRRAWCYQSTASGTSGTLAGWGPATYHDAGGSTVGAGWGMVDSTGALMTLSSSGSNGPGGGSWKSTCADGSVITTATGIFSLTVESPVPTGYVATEYKGGKWVPIPGGPTGSLTTVAGDPVRWLTCTIKTTDGSSYSADSAHFQESSAVMAPVKCPVLPLGKTPGHKTIVLNGGPNVLTLDDEDTTAAYQAANQKYPNCATASCSLDLIDKTGSCYDGDQSRCALWAQDPNRSTDYTCKFGSYTADISECLVLANRFDAAKVSTGDAYADPSTGTDVGKQTSPKTDFGNQPLDTGDTRAPCFPNGFLSIFNAGDMVTGMQCVLNWAFVPRASAVNADVAGLENQWKTKMPAQIGAIISAAAFIPPNTSGCNGITVPIAWLTKKPNDSMQIMNACPGSMLAPVAAWSFVIGDVVFTVLGALAITRYIAGVVAFRGLGSSASDGD